MDISEVKKELFIRLSTPSNAGTAVLLLSDPCPVDEIWQPNFAGIENTSSESVTASLCIVRSSDTRLAGGPQTVATLTAFGTNIVPLVAPGERIGFTLVGTAQKTAQWLTITGWIYRYRHEHGAQPSGVGGS